jgi:hypothetical protein
MCTPGSIPDRKITSKSAWAPLFISNSTMIS